jgi:lysozyme
MTDAELQKSIKKEEGLRLRSYKDINGNYTIGYGHLITDLNTVPMVISINQAEELFKQDYKQACSDYEKLNLSLDPVRRSAIIDMLFNMGLTRVLKFKNFLAALRINNFQEAEEELKDSKYARTLKKRSNKNSYKIRTGNVLLED